MNKVIDFILKEYPVVQEMMDILDKKRQSVNITSLLGDSIIYNIISNHYLIII